VSRYGDETAADVRDSVALALAWSAEALERDDRGAALAALDQILARFGDTNDPQLRLRVAAAMLRKGRLLELGDRRQEALAIYRRLLEQFPRSERPDIDELVAFARTRIETLSRRGPSGFRRRLGRPFGR
jgi:tetratricopeptide (TPR) repeat protein